MNPTATPDRPLPPLRARGWALAELALAVFGASVGAHLSPVLAEVSTAAPASASASGPTPSPNVNPGAALTYERDIRPIFRAHCFDCHGAGEELKGKLDLRLRHLAVRGGESGPAIAPGDPASSYLLRRIVEGEMPPRGGRPGPEEIAVLERWIAGGAPTAREEPDGLEPGSGLGITPEERAFWSFQPVRRPAAPAVEGAGAGSRARTEVDAFVLARLEAEGFGFAPDALRRTLALRASLDLLGLPPDPAEVAAFVEDPADDDRAFARYLDRLLASPHYGERWGRHWLDLAGYADSEGYSNADADRPWAYRYRDYVVAALNADKPFDQFVREQLAGDEMVPPPSGDLTVEQMEKLAATGFLRMAADGTGSGSNDATARNQTLADTVKIVSTSLLGLSVGCAQCHDHRYDPISQVDYTRLRAVFEPALNPKSWRTPPQRRVSLYTEADRRRAAEVEAEAQKVVAEKNEKQRRYIAEALDKELARHEEALRPQLRAAYETPAKERSAEQVELLKKYPSVNITAGNLYQYKQKAADELKALDKRAAEVRAGKPPEHFLRVLAEPALAAGAKAPVTRRFHRGDYREPREAVAPGGLTVAAPPGDRFDIHDNNPARPATGRRLAYAKWITGGRHPLVARVAVNHVWRHHFGRGLVGTPDDFGALGERPTHPELLDWLADEFVAGGWSLKRLHRLIMTSTAYRQSSDGGTALAAADPDNRLYGRWALRRLEAEAIRDRVLAAAGALSAELGGPPVPLKKDAAGLVVVDAAEGPPARRSLYLTVKRTQPVGVMAAFDAPQMETNCARRPTTTDPSQALLLMNSDFILAQARAAALRVRREVAADPRHPPSAAAAGLPEVPALGPAWSFGYGRFDPDAGRLDGLTALPLFVGGSWQGAKKLPDKKLGWVCVNAFGGHPGSPDLASVRRWTAPRAGTVNLSGRLGHASEHGDGVRARLISSRRGLLQEWVAHHGGAATDVAGIPVEAGETLDFAVDGREGGVSYDSYTWEVSLTLPAEGGAPAATFASRDGFHGPPAIPTAGDRDRPPLAAQVVRAFERIYGRAPNGGELEEAFAFTVAQARHHHAAGQPSPSGGKDKSKAAAADPYLAALTHLCQVLMGSNEFLYY